MLYAKPREASHPKHQIVVISSSASNGAESRHVAEAKLSVIQVPYETPLQHSFNHSELRADEELRCVSD